MDGDKETKKWTCGRCGSKVTKLKASGPGDGLCAGCYGDNQERFMENLKKMSENNEGGEVGEDDSKKTQESERGESGNCSIL